MEVLCPDPDPGPGLWIKHLGLWTTGQSVTYDLDMEKHFGTFTCILVIIKHFILFKSDEMLDI